MPVFRINKKQVTQLSLKEDGFGNEAELRDLFAVNLEEILGVRFLEKEYPTDGGRMDTLGLDENNSPVIIEYKWKENEEVFTQGLFYFKWLIKNKKHFELLVDKKLGEQIEVNWDKPRVILIARGFGAHVLGAVEGEKNIELKTYAYYQPDILHIEDVYTPSGVKVTPKKVAVKDTEAHTFEEHLTKTSKEIGPAIDLLRSKVVDLSGVTENITKSSVYYRTTKSFTRWEFRPTWVQVLLRDPKYNTDTKGIVRDVSSNEWGYKGVIKFDQDSDVDYVFNLVKESYDSTL